MFDLKTFKVLDKIPAAEDADAIIYDSASNRVQNAFGTPGTNGVDITNDGGSEIAVLDALGYNLNVNAVPEPGGITLFSSGLAFLAAVVYSRRASAAKAVAASCMNRAGIESSYRRFMESAAHAPDSWS